MSLMISKWTTLIAKQVNRQTHTLCVDDSLSTFTYQGSQIVKAYTFKERGLFYS